MAKRNELAKFVKVIQKIKLSSLNKAGRSAVSRVTRFVRQGYNITKLQIDDRLDETKARTVTDPVYKIIVSPKALPLILPEFKPKQFGKRVKGKKKRKGTPAGVKVTVRKKRRILIKSAFITEMKYGKQVFIRESNVRSAVHALYGTQVSQLFSSKTALNKLELEANKRFSEIFLQRLEFEASKTF